MFLSFAACTKRFKNEINLLLEDFVSLVMEPKYLEDQFKPLYTFVNLEDSKVRDAIDFVVDVIKYALKTQTYYVPKHYREQSWIYYIPARNQKERDDRDLIINTYKNAQKHEIQYYLLLHHCDAFVVLLWSVLRSNGVKARIVSDPYPVHHAYCEDEYGNIIDPLYEFCGVTGYTYNLQFCEKYDTPYAFYEKVHISPKEKRKPFEEACLAHLKRLE